MIFTDIMKSLIVCVQLLLITPLLAAAQDAYLKLKQEKVAYSPQGYYISGVADDRTNKETIGSVNKDRLLMKGGTAQSLMAFIAANVTQNKNASPVTLHIEQMNIDIKKAGGLWNVSVQCDFSFYTGDRKTVTYTGEARGKTEKDPLAYVEQFIRKNIENDLKKFEGWWSQNRGDIVLDKNVRVNVTMGKTASKPNTMVFSLARPLQIADFKGPVQMHGAELAETLSGVSMNYSGDVVNSQTIIDITVTPYFDYNRSWMREEGKNPYVLGHEQAHFDITAIKACELVQKLRATRFTADNYEQEIKAIHKQNSQESDAEEQQYDTETNHGINREKQMEWQKRITERARTVGCF